MPADLSKAWMTRSNEDQYWKFEKETYIDLVWRKWACETETVADYRFDRYEQDFESQLEAYVRGGSSKSGTLK